MRLGLGLHAYRCFLESDPTYTFLSDEQPLNTPSPRVSSFEPDSNLTLSSAASALKAFFPIDTTDLGIVIFVNFISFANAPSPIVLSEDDSLAPARVLQPLNALSPISTIFWRLAVLLLVLPTKLVHPLNASFPMYFMLLP